MLENFKEAHVLVLSTAEKNGTPHSRFIANYGVDGNTILLVTGSNKDMYKQLKENNVVSITGQYFEGFVRAEGTIEFVEGREQEVLEKDPNVKEMYAGRESELKAFVFTATKVY